MACAAPIRRYLDEFVFRWNRRRHTATAFDTLLGIGTRLRPATTATSSDNAADPGRPGARPPGSTSIRAECRSLPGLETNFPKSKSSRR